MTSLLRSIRQTHSDAQNFVILKDPTNTNSYLKFTPDATGNGTNVTGAFSTEANASAVPTAVGTMLRDMGSVVVSSGLMFRRVQYVLAGSANTDSGVNPNGAGSGLTNGVSQTAATTVSQYKTFYIQLGANGGTNSLVVTRV